MMTGKAVEYFRALARCCPPQPEEADFGPFLTREYSIKHWRRRIMLGTLIIRGTMIWPPQLLSGLFVEEVLKERNMHAEMKRSPKTFA